MINSLFNIFDPTILTFYPNLKLNWVFIVSCLVFFPKKYWRISSVFFSLIFKIQIRLFNSFKNLLKKEIRLILTFLTLFRFIFSINLLRLFPYIFSVTAQLRVNLRFALILWIRFLLYIFINKYKKFISHLIPIGTPIFLRIFIVFIETIRNIIRPVTLSIRLTANIITGHLLLILLRNIFLDISNFFIPIRFILILFLIFLELAVSFIQAYVFIMLSILYLEETK